MKGKPERVAWAIITTAFLVFCSLAVAVPWGVRSYLLNASDAFEARVEALVGTVVVETPGSGTAKPVPKGRSLSASEGSVIIVDETSEAAISFFDHSEMRLFSGTRITLDEMRAPRFGFSSQRGRIAISENGGRIRVGTALSSDVPVDFVVRSLQATTELREDGSYSIEVSNDKSEIVVTRGEAQVTAMDQAVKLKQRERTVVGIGQAPEAPMPAAKDLVVNGAFNEPLGVGWTWYNDQGLDGGEVDGEVLPVLEESRRAVRFLRSGGHGNHCETVIRQEIDRLLADPLIMVKVRTTVKLLYQSLSGGGYLSSEYPLMIRLVYRDAYDSEAEWVHGFYYQNADSNPTTYGELIQQDRWYIYESENLLEVMPIIPSRIVSIEVYASGWDYDSMVSEISLIVE
jgi:hypothetical protein